MRKLISKVRREAGQGMVEYGLIIALVSIAVVLTLVTLGSSLNTIFQSVISNL